MENFTPEQIGHIKGVIESLLFVNEKSVTLDQISKVLETVNNKDVKNIIHLMIDEYQEQKRGMTIVEIAGGYQMLSNALYASYIRSFYKTKHKDKLSKPSLETVAIIAYKQPVTRGDIELIRGVNSDGVVANLLKKELIKIVGRRDVPGKPYLYGTTRQFLEYFGLKSLSNLPKLQEEFPKLKTMDDHIAEENAEAGIVPIEDDSESNAAGPAEGENSQESPSEDNVVSDDVKENEANDTDPVAEEQEFVPQESSPEVAEEVETLEEVNEEPKEIGA